MFPAAPSPASRRHLAAVRERQSPEVSSQVSGGGRVSNSPTTRRAVHRFEDRSGGLKAAQPGVPSGPPSGTCWSCYAPAGSPPRPSPPQRCSISPSPPASSRSGLTPVSSARPSACLPAASSACHPEEKRTAGKQQVNRRAGPAVTTGMAGLHVVARPVSRQAVFDRQPPAGDGQRPAVATRARLLCHTRRQQPRIAPPAQARTDNPRAARRRT